MNFGRAGCRHCVLSSQCLAVASPQLQRVFSVHYVDNVLFFLSFDNLAHKPKLAIESKASSEAFNPRIRRKSHII